MIHVQLITASYTVDFAVHTPILGVLRELARLVANGDKACHLSSRLQGFPVVDPLLPAVVIAVPTWALDVVKCGTVTIRFRESTESYRLAEIREMFNLETD